MDTTTQEKIVIELIVNALSGKLDSSSNFNPKFLAEAIVQKLNFNLTLEESKLKSINESIITFNSMIDDIDKDMDEEMSKLTEKETLLKNFILGQKTACEKLKESLKTI